MLLKKLQQKDYTKAQKTHNKEKPPVYAEIEFLTIYCLLIKITQNKIQVIFKEKKGVINDVMAYFSFQIKSKVNISYVNLLQYHLVVSFT